MMGRGLPFLVGHVPGVLSHQAKLHRPHFTDEKIQAQTGEAIYLKPRSWEESGFCATPRSRPRGSRLHTSSLVPLRRAQGLAEQVLGDCLVSE